MDGNGRWARQRRLPRLAGHRAGTENIRRIVEGFAVFGVKHLTLYAFSTENWNRPDDEVHGLMDILHGVIRKEAKALHEMGARLRHIGSLDRISPELRTAMVDAVELTKDNHRINLNIAFNYGGRSEILEAVRRMLRDGIPHEEIDEATLSGYLYTADIPDPDLIIRTAGEMRLSNFLLWQSAYSEYYCTSALWPAFDEDEIKKALMAYSQRGRRFGKVGV
jgi:undecaprenyl diphosphate synthase